MIQANELRIGNWVQVAGIYKSSILRAGLVRVDAELILLVEAGKILVLGIPLTPETLEQAGLPVKTDDLSWVVVVKAGTIDIILRPNGTYIDGVDWEQIKQVEYLHQLQNLYFALTGEELKIEL